MMAECLWPVRKALMSATNFRSPPLNRVCTAMPCHDAQAGSGPHTLKIGHGGLDEAQQAVHTVTKTGPEGSVLVPS